MLFCTVTYFLGQFLMKLTDFCKVLVKLHTDRLTIYQALCRLSFAGEGAGKDDFLAMMKAGGQSEMEGCLYGTAIDPMTGKSISSWYCGFCGFRTGQRRKNLMEHLETRCGY